MALKEHQIISTLKRMEDYIEQDGCEKAEEIDVKAEEEFISQKKIYLEPRLAMVKKHYNNLEIKYQQQTALDISKLKNHGYREILTARNKMIDELFDSAKSRLVQLTNEKNKALYKKVILQLIIQGLAKMLEPSVIIKVRKQDINIAKGVLKQGQDYFNTVTGMAIVLVVNEKEFIPESQNGGVWLYSKNGSVIIDNSLDSKLEVVRNGVLPYIRKALFGFNPNRKHSI